MTNKQGNILVVDDDPDVLTSAHLLLKRHFSLVTTEEEPSRIPEHLQAHAWDVILLDMNFKLGANSGEEGLSWLHKILQQQADALVILMTAYGGVETAVSAIKLGAVDFILKPWHNERLLTTIRTALTLKQSRREVAHLRSREREILPLDSSSGLIGHSKAMQAIRTIIQRIAPTEANVLILGENGTGKEVVAREVHLHSARKDDIFLAVDLGSVSETLFESELFGHKKGAFTGAVSDRIGRFQAASGGSIFLDEIGNLPLHLQSKLLTVLEQRQVVPLGSNQAVPIDIRLICASNRPLKQMVEEGTFREDLLYRINTVELHLPPLRERQDDIPVLLDHFTNFYAEKYQRNKPRFSTSALMQLQHYHWPGNIRELRHAVERALIMNTSDNLEASEFLLNPPGGSNSDLTINADTEDLNLEHLEKTAVGAALKKHSGNISHAAKALGITRTSLYRRMEKYGL